MAEPNAVELSDRLGNFPAQELCESCGDQRWTWSVDLMLSLTEPRPALTRLCYPCALDELGLSEVTR